MPAYSWSCQICDSTVDSGNDVCTTCGNKSSLSTEDIELLRAQYKIDKCRRQGITLSTTPNLEGFEITEYLGLVVGEAVLGANVIKDIFAGIRDFIGGRSGSYESELKKARSMAFADISEEAARMGANAVVGIDLDYEVMGTGGSIMMVSVSGTAVLAKKI